MDRLRKMAEPASEGRQTVQSNAPNPSAAIPTQISGELMKGVDFWADSDSDCIVDYRLEI